MHRINGKTVVCLALILSFLVVVPGLDSRALASAGGDTTVVGAAVGSVAAVTLAYLAWRYRPSNRDKVEPLIPGEFYVGGFIGGSGVQNNDWQFKQTPVTFTNVGYRPGVVGGLKFGWFTPWFPRLGLEGETNFTRNDIRSQTFRLSSGGFGSNVASLPAQDLYVWTLAFKIMFRHGFFPDKEVPFGRLQPYAGIGPGFTVIYGDSDSAKNFSLEVQAGVRYMMLQNVSAFLEYKFSKQWDVELESQTFTVSTPNGFLAAPRGRAQFDFDSHKIVLGVAYHF